MPQTWEKTYFNWMENIQPWCVSRQLWWGHQIPAWYDDAGKVYVAETEAEAQARGGRGRCRCAAIHDVLDTWFSSALWPFGTLGWPEETELLQAPLSRHGADHRLRHHLLLGRPDDDAGHPFHGRGAVAHRLSATAWSATRTGQKMSKSKGNTVDPLGLIDRYGADALRFTLAAMESQGRDIKLDEKRVEGYRNFATKLWNAARFCQANGIGASKTIEPPAGDLPVNRWIIGETVKTVQALDLAMAELALRRERQPIYQFVWANFCDWYLELIKPVLGTADGPRPAPTPTRPARSPAGCSTRSWSCSTRSCRSSPRNCGTRWASAPYDLILAKWPMPDARALDPEAGPEIDWLIRLVSGIRAARSELNVPPGAKLALHVRDAGPEDSGAAAAPRRGAQAARADRNGRRRRRSGRRRGAGGRRRGDLRAAARRRDRSRRREARAWPRPPRRPRRSAIRSPGGLNNPSFVERAKPEAVDKARADHAEKASDAERYRAALARLG